MNIEDVFKNHSSNIAICMVDEEEGMLEIEKFHKEFNDNYQIVPKEQWCVTITVSEEIDSTQTIGPFDSEETANLFATIWNRKREESIDKIIEANPDGDYDFPYLKAKSNKLDWSEKCDEIRIEIFETLKGLE